MAASHPSSGVGGRPTPVQKNYPPMINALARGGRRTGEQHERWAMDEPRLGLKPLRRRIWAKRGQRPVCPVHQRYEWRYLYGFVHPNSGRSFWALMPTVSIAAFN